MCIRDSSEALHVSVEWLKGETDEYETDITDKRELQIRDAMGDICLLYTSWLSNAPVGSSASKSFGLLIIALAQAQRCFCPPDT